MTGCLRRREPRAPRCLTDTPPPPTTAHHAAFTASDSGFSPVQRAHLGSAVEGQIFPTQATEDRGTLARRAQWLSSDAENPLSSVGLSQSPDPSVPTPHPAAHTQEIGASLGSPNEQRLAYGHMHRREVWGLMGEDTRAQL